MTVIGAMLLAGVSCAGSDGGADTTSPTISNVTATAITENSATIAWSTDEDASSQVEYGATTSYGTSSTLDSSLMTSHSVVLTTLAAGSNYHYRVKSKDAAGNESASADNSLATVSLWQVTVVSAKSQSALDSQWVIETSGKIFIVVQLSLLPTRSESNSINVMDILLTDSGQQSWKPVGLKAAGSSSIWGMATSGDCQIDILEAETAMFTYNHFRFEYPNDQGIYGGSTGSSEKNGSVTVMTSAGNPLNTSFAYVISSQDLQTGGLQLKLPGTVPITLGMG